MVYRTLPYHLLINSVLGLYPAEGWYGMVYRTLPYHLLINYVLTPCWVFIQVAWLLPS